MALNNEHEPINVGVTVTIIQKLAFAKLLVKIARCEQYSLRIHFILNEPLDKIVQSFYRVTFVSPMKYECFLDWFSF